MSERPAQSRGSGWTGLRPGSVSGAGRVFGEGLAVIGHRGLGRGTVDGLRENSPASVAAAVAVGLPWVEVDVRRTADDALVVGHDPVTPRGREVAACTLEEARSDGMAQLEEIFAVVPRDVGVVLDVKASISDALRPLERTTAALVAPVARAQARRRPLMAYSFDPSALLVFRAHAAEVTRGMLTWRDFPISAAVPAAVHLGAHVVTAHTGSFVQREAPEPAVPGDTGTAGVGERYVAESVHTAHLAGLEVAVWCPRPKDVVVLAAGGVDAVCVDDVPTALDELAASGLALRLTDRRTSRRAT